MNILACDPATSFGWAHSSGMSGVWKLHVRSDESQGMRLVRLRAQLQAIYAGDPFDLLVYEMATGRGRSSRAVIVQCELQGQIKAWCEEKGIDYTGVSPTELKKYATGKGNANKEQMVDALERRLGRIFEDADHDRVDALWLLELAKERYGKEDAC